MYQHLVLITTYLENSDNKKLTILSVYFKIYTFKEKKNCQLDIKYKFYRNKFLGNKKKFILFNISKVS